VPLLLLARLLPHTEHLDRRGWPTAPAGLGRCPEVKQLGKRCQEDIPCGAVDMNIVKMAVDLQCSSRMRGLAGSGGRGRNDEAPCQHLRSMRGGKTPAHLDLLNRHKHVILLHLPHAHETFNRRRLVEESVRTRGESCMFAKGKGCQHQQAAARET